MPFTDQQIAFMIRQRDDVINALHQEVQALKAAYQAGHIGTGGDLREALEKVAQAVAYNAEVVKNLRALATNQGAVYSEQIPGKREPRWLLSDITIPAGTTAPVPNTTPVPSTGPFEIAQIMGTVRANVPVYQLGGIITRQIRFRAHNSALADPLASPDPAAATQPSYTPDITYNGAFDFLWDYSSGKSARVRMSAPIPSVFLFSNDRPFYLACGDLLDASDAWLTSVTPLFGSFIWPNGVPGTGQTATDVAQPYIVSLVAHGVLYAQAPDYKV